MGISTHSIGLEQIRTVDTPFPGYSAQVVQVAGVTQVFLPRAKVLTFGHFVDET